VFTKNQDAEQERHLKNLHGRIAGLTLPNLRKGGYKISEGNNPEHLFNQAAKTAGRNLAYPFLKTNKFTLRNVIEETRLFKMAGFSRFQVTCSFQDLTLF
jgi:hypothetical protein